MSNGKTKVQKVSMLEEGLSYILEHYDKKTRKGIFIAVNHICDAKERVQETLISREMLKKLKTNEPAAVTGLLARNIVDLLTSEKMAADLTRRQQKRIIRAVAMRLIMELDPEEIEDMTEQLMPTIIDDKTEERDRYMYS